MNEEEPFTIDHVADVLAETLLPFYKGFPESMFSPPKFRKTLTSEESTNLLTTLHQLIATIRTQKKESSAA